jgi:16S rRNA (uracil1498-N3)-methyltransferase
MHRFILPPETIRNSRVHFPEETARQMRSVLRLRVGQRVLVLDGLGSQYEVELVELRRDSAFGKVHSKSEAGGEPQLHLTLYLALTQREKFEWMLQKCTEIGAARFVPVITTRSLLQDESDAEKKYTRWQRILREAAEQSGRGRVPQLDAPQSFAQAIGAAGRDHGLLLIPWEQERELALKQVLRGYTSPPDGLPSVGLCIGPEGGFTEKEVELARQAGFHSITLGERILRMETAAVVAAALVMYELSG